VSPRPLRVQAADVIYHAFSRATGDEMLYRDGSDRDRFLSILAEAVGKFELTVHFVVVLGTHHHLLLTTSKSNLGAAMQWANGVYCQTYNRRHRRRGHLLAGRYGTELVKSGRHAAALVPYLALNPVRAGLVKRPEDWLWSSYASLTGLAAEWSFVKTGWVLDQFDPDPVRARALLRADIETALAYDSVA
jgi:putative transposase